MSFRNTRMYRLLVLILLLLPVIIATTTTVVEIANVTNLFNVSNRLSNISFKSKNGHGEMSLRPYQTSGVKLSKKKNESLM